MKETSRQSLVSIIMPAYNAQKFIAASIESVLNQDYENWELLIVNDGSTDNTAFILLNYNDPRIKVFTQTNKGVSAARNYALENISGEYILFLDADDVLLPSSISARVNYLNLNPQVNILDGTVIVTNEDLSTEIRRFIPAFKGKVLNRYLKLDEKVFVMPSAMIRRFHGFNYRFNEAMTHSEDILFYIQIANATGAIYDFIPSPILIYRRPQNSAMANLDGLANGYISLYRNILDLNKTDILSGLALKLKISKIMFLSFISQKQYHKAFKFVLYFFFKKVENSCSYL